MNPRAVGISLLLALSAATRAVAGPYDDAHAAHERGDWKTYEQIVRPLAEHGEARAEADLGAAYLSGWGPPQDYGQALIWLRKAADQGDVNAANTVGLMYQDGQGVAKDDAQAIAWYLKGLAKGDESSRNMLLLVCLMDHPVGPGCVTAAEIMRKAAEAGDKDSQVHLAQFYDGGQFPGIARDPERATAWYRKAAEAGFAPAQSALAMRLEMGIGGPEDPAQALTWYTRAADGGEMLAQMTLAQRYADPTKPDHDDTKAFHWNIKLAERGIADAQRKVGVAYALGRGTLRDDVKAYAWLTVASQDRNTTGTDALALQAIATRLSSEQLVEAKREAEALKASEARH